MDASTGKISKWRAGFAADYKTVFVDEWSPYFGIVLIVVTILALMSSGLFWGVFGGLRLWGDWFNRLIGLGPLLDLPQKLDNPLMNQISLMDMLLVVGAFSAALMAGHFRISRPPMIEYVRGAFGGIMMGLGASLAGGCTTGAFFTPVLHSAPSGWVMWFGLSIGAIIGLKLLLWTLDIEWGSVAPPVKPVSPGLLRLYPYFGLLVFAAVVVWTTKWYLSSDHQLVIRAIVIIGGFALGFIMNRSRVCVARSIREPFMTGDGTMSKAVMLGIVIGAPMAALMFRAKLIDPYIPIPPTFWIGSLLGGVVFGVGMIFAGGCASGSLWRMGEGHLKLWVAAFFFAWTGSIFHAVLHKLDLNVSVDNLDDPFNGLMTRLGVQMYLPDTLGSWVAAFAVTGAMVAIWYIFVRYNESTEKFTVF